MKILLFFIISIMSGAFSYAQHIKLVNINTDSYPNIKIIVELNQNSGKKQFQIYESAKQIDFTIRPLKEEKPTYLYYVIDYSSFSKEELNIIFDAIINSLKSFEKENLYINIGLAKPNAYYKCFFPLSYEYSSKIKDFIQYAKKNTINLKERTNPECLIKEAINFLNTKNAQNITKQTILLITNNIKDYSEANLISKSAENAEGILLKIVSPLRDTLNIKPNNFYVVSKKISTEAWQNTLQNASEDDDLTNLSLHKQYLIEFKINKLVNSGIIELHYNNEILKLNIQKPVKYYFSNKYAYLVIIIIFGISIIILLRRIYLLKKHIQSLKETVSLLFDKKLKILSKQTENPVLEIRIENNFKNYHIKKPNTSIGRGKECDVIIKDMTVSTLHATITNEGGEFYIQDNESTNGVFVNDLKIKKKNIKPGDIIRMGKAILTLHY